MGYRRQLLKRLDKAWGTFKESYAGLSDAQLMEPGVTGAWSVRAILAHVTTWEEEALKHLPLILEGGTPPRYSVRYGGIDAFNAQMTEQKRSFSLSEVLRQLDQTHRGLIDFIQSAPEDQFIRETRFRRRLRLDTYSHYPEARRGDMEMARAAMSRKATFSPRRAHERASRGMSSAGAQTQEVLPPYRSVDTGRRGRAITSALPSP